MRFERGSQARDRAQVTLRPLPAAGSTQYLRTAVSPGGRPTSSFTMTPYKSPIATIWSSWKRSIGSSNSLIMSRLSNPAEGCVVIVAHKLNENDISGHVLQQGGFRHICLPAVAPRKKRFKMDDQTWLRRKGDPLRPDQYPKKVIARLRKSVLVPEFETLYQQNPGGSSSIRIRPEHFHFRDLHRMPEQPIILSVDPGGVSIHCDKSYSVIQLVIPLAAGDHLLWDQFRAQCGLDELWQAFKHLARRTPSAILIENTANGPALIERAKRFSRYRVIPVTPDGRSNVERLRRHICVIRGGHIHLRQGAAWIGEYIDEMSKFPSSPFDDQVDGTTQYLDYISQKPTLMQRPPSGLCAGWTSRGALYGLNGPPDMQAHGVAVRVGKTGDCEFMLSRSPCGQFPELWRTIGTI